MISFRRHVLPNGLRIIHVPMPDNPTAVVMLLAEVGSHFEAKSEAGISHFLEHMCFKGTVKRPKPFDIVRELDQIGANYNAFTGRESTGYWAKSDKKHFSTIFDICADIYINSTLPKAEIEKEKGVVIEEINMYQDDPQSVVSEVFRALMYGDQPAGWDIAGTKETVAALTQEQLIAYRSKHYVPSKTVLVVSGGVTEVDVLNHAQKSFGNLLSAEVALKNETIVPKTGPKVSVRHKKTDQTHVILGVPAFSCYDPRRYTLRLMKTILSGGMSSRLFQRFREEMGVGYYIRAGASLAIDSGTFEISAGVDSKRLDEVVQEIVAQMQKLRDVPATSDEIKKAKDYLAGKMYLGLETSEDYGDFYGPQELYAKEPIISPDEVIARTSSVTAEDIHALAKELFLTEGLHLAVVGPHENEESLKKYLRFS